MIDYHCHILPGIDDGAESIAEAVEISRLLVAAGFSQVHCTPHCIRGLYEPSTVQVRRAVAALQQILDQADIPLQLLTGMEYYLDEFFVQRLDDPLPLGDSRLLLVEVPGQADAERIEDALLRVLEKGLVPLLAHPERCRLLDDGENTRRWPRWWGRSELPVGEGLLPRLRAAGVLLQGNLGSLAGYYGEQVERRGRELVSQKAYYVFGSDAHAATSLQSYLFRGLQVAASG